MSSVTDKLKLQVWSKCSPATRAAILARPTVMNRESQQAAVREIILKVRTGGDTGIAALTKKFDKVNVSSLAVAKAELKQAYSDLPASVQQAFARASANIKSFHEQEKINSKQQIFEMETQVGIRCGKMQVPIEKVGFYIPGGLAPLPSTVFMLAIPAQIAGCGERILCTPPQNDGKPDPYILAAAYISGVERVFCVGGAQAVAAMAYGTETVPKVDKIFGPGNSWVTIAKQMVALDAAGASCDMPAGPSEVLVIATEDSNPDWLAMDLLSQAEHGPDSQVILLTTSESVGLETIARLEYWSQQLSRSEMALASLAHSSLILCDSLQTAFDISNEYAPEHLIFNYPVSSEDENQIKSAIKNAGSLFIGPWTPESLGDYASGTNHVLPTGGFAKSYSGLGVTSFQKAITYQTATPEGLLSLGPVVETLAEIEGLTAHKMAVSLRLQTLKDEQ